MLNHEPVDISPVAEIAQRLRSLQDPEVQRSLERLRRRYSKHAMESDDLRRLLDQDLGERTLTEELYALRGE